MAKRIYVVKAKSSSSSSSLFGFRFVNSRYLDHDARLLIEREPATAQRSLFCLVCVYFFFSPWVENLLKWDAYSLPTTTISILLFFFPSSFKPTPHIPVFRGECRVSACLCTKGLPFSLSLQKLSLVPDLLVVAVVFWFEPYVVHAGLQ